jgi:hypothetical protein
MGIERPEDGEVGSKDSFPCDDLDVAEVTPVHRVTLVICLLLDDEMRDIHEEGE